MLSGPADYGARFDAAIRAEHDRMFRAAHAAGEREPAVAYRIDAVLAVLEQGAGTDAVNASTVDADALDADAEGAGGAAAAGRPGRRRSGRETKVIITVDAAALARGHVDGDETCDIAGIGRVSLSAVRALIPDAHIAYVITNGRDVSVAHLGRQVTAHQRTALEARGYECEVPGCRAAHLLEIDHVRDWAISRRTTLDDLAWLCMIHHDRKTTQGYKLTGPPGRRSWHDPNGHVIAHDLDPPTTSAA
ncbi:hypothetical protein BH23ACT9_BH23ACT9_22560 [soil metagenome]